MIAPPVYSREELERERQQAIEDFRKVRMEEPLEDYLEAFEEYQSSAEELLETTVDLSDLETHAMQFLGDKRLMETFRYIAGPPISHDDLKTLVAHSIAKKWIQKDASLVRTIIETVMIGLDKRRFPWVAENREATEEERRAAVIATAALMATRRVGTERRMEGKTQQERRVMDALTAIGFRQVAGRDVDTLDHAPDSGEFCGESQLGSRKADIIVRLWDRRVMGIECKVSNSETNSIKRLNNDAAIKAVTWRREFGERNVVPAAVMSGVYKLDHLESAQAEGLSLFWAHDVQRLLDWIEGTKEAERKVAERRGRFAVE